MNKLLLITFIALAIVNAQEMEDKMQSSPLDEAQRNDLVDTINTFRRLSFKGYRSELNGRRLPCLTWNEDLAAQAAETTDQCKCHTTNPENFSFSLESIYNEFIQPIDLPICSIFGSQLKKGQKFFSKENFESYIKNNAYEELAAHALSNKVKSFGCASTTCNQEDGFFANHFTCIFDTALAENEPIINDTDYLERKDKGFCGNQEDAPTPKPTCEDEDCHLEQRDKNQLTRIHNRFRQTISRGVFAQRNEDLWPEASAEIQDLEWCDELEAFAQEGANRCELKHTNPETLEEKNYGENIFESDWKATMTAVVKDWFMEGKNHNAIPVSYANNFQQSKNGDQIGHFSQVAWASTQKLGCARKYCPDFAEEDGTQTAKTIVFCNYYPAGNTIGQPIYEAKEESNEDNTQDA